MPPIDTCDKAEPHRLLNSSISPPNQLGDTVGSYLGFGVVLVALAFAAYALFETYARDVRAKTRLTLAAAMELVTTPTLIDLNPPAFVAIDATPAVTVARAIPKRHTQKQVRATHLQESSVALAHAAMDVAPAPEIAPVSAITAGAGVGVPPPAQTAKQSYCTASAVATNQCRPEQLWTGQ